MSQKEITSKVPKLRFREFQGEWNFESINNLSLEPLSNGVFNDPKKVWSWIKIINVKDMYEWYFINTDNLTLLELDKKDFEKNKVLYWDIFFTRSSLVKEWIAYPNIYLSNSNDVTYDGHLIRLRLNNHKILPNFAIYNLRTNNSRVQFVSKGKTTTMTTIGQEEIWSIKISFPSLPEQQKIASFLSTVDEKIEKLKTKKSLLEKYKKWVMQKIFSREIRFRDENGEESEDWKNSILWDYLVEKNERTTSSGQYPIISSTIKGLFLQSDYFNRSIASDDNTGYKILKKNQLVFSPQNLWLWNLSVNNKFDIGIVSPSYKIFDFKNAIPDFFSYFLVMPRMIFQYIQSSEQWASVVRRNINMDMFLNISVEIPSLSEQQKIASFLSELDKKINAIDSQIGSTEKWKKGLLQAMFV